MRARQVFLFYLQEPYICTCRLFQRNRIYSEKFTTSEYTVESVLAIKVVSDLTTKDEFDLTESKTSSQKKVNVLTNLRWNWCYALFLASESLGKMAFCQPKNLL